MHFVRSFTRQQCFGGLKKETLEMSLKVHVFENGNVNFSM